MYVILEYVTYLVIVAILAGLLFGASALAIITKDKAPHLAEAYLKAIYAATRRLDQDQTVQRARSHLRSLLPERFQSEIRKT